MIHIFLSKKKGETADTCNIVGRSRIHAEWKEQYRKEYIISDSFKWSSERGKQTNRCWKNTLTVVTSRRLGMFVYWEGHMETSWSKGNILL